MGHHVGNKEREAAGCLGGLLLLQPHPRSSDAAFHSLLHRLASQLPTGTPRKDLRTQPKHTQEQTEKDVEKELIQPSAKGGRDAMHLAVPPAHLFLLCIKLFATT